jgi:hypothetical protein
VFASDETPNKAGLVIFILFLIAESLELVLLPLVG